MSVAKVAALAYYPVKGLAGIPVESAEVGPTGLLHDRLFMLVEPDGSFLSQRKLPAMATLRAELAGDTLRLSAPGAPDHYCNACFTERYPISFTRAEEFQLGLFER